MTPEKITIIDGSGYIFRAFYAIQRLSTSKGFPTNAVYGFITMLMKVLDVEKPTKLLIAFDTPKPTFRKKMYAEYKANRSAMPEDLAKQIPHILRAVDCFGIRRIELEGYEADDVIGTVAKRAEKEGYQVEIISGDKDLMQLVNSSITLYDSMKDKRIGPDGVKEKFGVRPDQIVDLLALMGDSSDNIPGVSGIGEKTAADLINQFDSLDGIFDNLDHIKQEKRRETLKTERDTAYLSKELARIRCDVPLDFGWEEMSYSGPRREELQSFLEELEFLVLLKRFDFKPAEKKASLPKGHYEIIRTEERLIEVLNKLRKAPWVAVDTETTSLMAYLAKLVGVSLCGFPGEAFYIPIGHQVPGNPEALQPGQLPEEVALKHLKPFLQDSGVRKIGQNLKYDLQVLLRWGVELNGIVGDTLLESYLIDPDQPHNLDSLAARYLDHQNIKYEEVTGKGKAQISFAEVPIDRAGEYSAEDADVTLRLNEKLSPDLDKAGLGSLYRDVEVPLLEVLAQMEYRGILVDSGLLTEMSSNLENDLVEAEAKVFKAAGEPVNINSPKQLSKLLFEKLKLPVIRKTKTGYSTDESVLLQLSSEHEICKWILDYRELGKLKSTYVDGLLAQINPETGRVHTSYNQTVTATGRLSSSNPNLQNIPVGHTSRYDIRSVFVASQGTSLLSADYSQVELRLLADMSGDVELRRAFNNGEDVHEFTGRLIFGTSSVSPEQRRIAKTINFGVVYGQSAYGLSQTLKISPKEAKEFIDTYFARYSGIQAFLRGIVEGARRDGFVSTRLGRRRYLPDINAKNRMLKDMAERAAINAPIQGTAADMIKVAMVSLERRLKRESLNTRMLLQVHDELVLEVPNREKTQAEAVVREEMERAMSLAVPLKVDVGWGQNWLECDG